MGDGDQFNQYRGEPDEVAAVDNLRKSLKRRAPDNSSNSSNKKSVRNSGALASDRVVKTKDSHQASKDNQTSISISKEYAPNVNGESQSPKEHTK